MSKLAVDIFKITMALMDEILDSGGVDAGTTMNYKAKAPYLMTKLQNELINNGNYRKIFEYTRKNLTPSILEFDTISHEDEDIEYKTLDTCYAYTFEVDGEATVTIQHKINGAWETTQTINVPNTVTTKTRYFGRMTPINATETRITFGGDYYYNFTNVGVFKQKFSSDNKIPESRQYIPLTMPSDFNGVDSIISEDLPQGYVRDTNYYWEGFNTLYIPYTFTGTVKVVYKATPEPITEDNFDTYELAVDDITATTVLVDGLTAHLMMGDGNEYSIFHQDRFAELKTEMGRPKVSYEGEIDDNIGVSLNVR